MFRFRSISFLQILSVYLITLLVAGCIDPVEPEFEYKEGLVFIEGFASTAPGASFVSIKQSAIEFGIYRNVLINGADVVFKEVNSGITVSLLEQDEIYVPPYDFVVTVGSTWELIIKLSNGTVYKSEPESVLNPVEIQSINAVYEPNLFFRESSGKFVPGHSVNITFQDPPEEENYYYWSFRSFENIDICEKCSEGIFRNGGCETAPSGTMPFNYYNYRCETDCWQIRFPENISIYDDKFTNGNTIASLPVAQIPLYSKENVVVEIQQFNLTPAAYQYYKVLKDIINNSGGFNAPPPAALVGNMINLNDADDFILGRFSAATTATASIFIDRSSINEEPILPPELSRYEDCEVCDRPCPIDCVPITQAACGETRFRTAIVPNGWIGK